MLKTDNLSSIRKNLLSSHPHHRLLINYCNAHQYHKSSILGTIQFMCDSHISDHIHGCKMWRLLNHLTDWWNFPSCSITPNYFWAWNRPSWMLCLDSLVACIWDKTSICQYLKQEMPIDHTYGYIQMDIWKSYRSLLPLHDFQIHRPHDFWRICRLHNWGILSKNCMLNEFIHAINIYQ